DRENGEAGWDSFYKPILLHEGAHQLLHELTGRRNLPVWFDEGLATFFQAWDVHLPVEESLAQQRRKGYALDVLEAAWREDRLVPLGRLIRLDWAAWSADGFGPGTDLHYAEAEIGRAHV